VERGWRTSRQSASASLAPNRASGTRRSLSTPCRTPKNTTRFVPSMPSSMSPIHSALRDLATCTRAGGRLSVVMPSRDSAITEIPNFVLNAPPHHLNWWNEDALRALADCLDLLTEAIEAGPFSFDTIIYWMGRCAPKLIGNRYFRAHWVRYGALAWSWLFGRTCDAVFRLPTAAKPRPCC
jgi:hypothetical protein